MNQEVCGWGASDGARNALSAALNGREAPFTPVAPLFVDCPFRGYVDRRLYGLWGRQVEEGGRVDVEFETYARFRFEVMCEVIDRFNSPPCWVRFPWTPSRSEVEGCRVVRKAGRLVWVDQGGAETPLTEQLRLIDRRPGPWPMEHPASRSLKEVKEMLARDPQGLIPPESLGDPGLRGESVSEGDLRAEGRLTVWDWLRQRYRGAMPAYVMGSYPTQLTIDILGFESLMVGFLEAPEVVHQVSRLGMPKNRAYWKAVRDAGVEVVHLSEYSWGNQVSPKVYRELIAPYTREMIDFYHGIGFRVLLYVMGDIRPILGQIADQPFDALAVEEGRKGYELDIGFIRRELGGDRVLFGNVPTGLIVQGAPEDLLAEVRRQVSAAGGHGRFVVSTGEPIPPETQPERVRLFCDSTRLIDMPNRT
ncbi:MAG: hypothetical protein A3F84_17080 [Candidatus Handelsmanbacteria bacterium RIFCSPLOWO2_12_FULL_64_10]|uniref:Uroporphyrinogen decarboxylase (URO-D) domain-containing protein n=1 Tax=Handelsmanbacteria sp. (strain RIFCSPLOWO2_12_FULL_64_10) TaxID=1817868 RepID=A0A1F6C9L9_HANXR|nr:MAG: hypothetical protein A3F84_17080 [Candidatus Handelsmanbacteria bacterium RIFCSPLOWO2_12_FULL_64_10]